MICPHCSTAVKYNWITTGVINKNDATGLGVDLLHTICPNCENLVVLLREGKIGYNNRMNLEIKEETSQQMIHPKESGFHRNIDVPEQYLEDYEEAIKVLSASPKASAALTRRLLQNILREEFKIVERTLDVEIQKFIQLEGIPSHLTDAVDAIRIIGNLAAHPTKNKNTGEIVAVENGEAEWLIEVIEALFDFVFIQPIKLQRRRDELNLKLAETGKPPLKKKDKKS